MLKNILVTGGAGFIGSNIVVELLNRGCNVVVLDNLSPQIHGSDPLKSPLYLSIKDHVKFINGTVLSKINWLTALEGIDAVIHLAAETGTGQSMYEIERYTDVNIKGTSIFFDILANETHTVKKIIVASSRSIYGEGRYFSEGVGNVYPVERTDQDMAVGDFEVKCPITGNAVQLLPTDEESLIHPSSIYGITKQVQEQMFLVMGKALGIPAVAFRYQNVYGAGQSLSNPYTGILSIFSTKIKNNNPITIFEDGLESRDFVYVDDVVDATLLGLEKEEANYQVFNVGYGKPISVLEVANTLKHAYQSDVDIIVSGNYRLGDIRHNYADLKKISTLLGFSPKISFVEGISRFTHWVNQQEIHKDVSDSSLVEMKAKGLYK